MTYPEDLLCGLQRLLTSNSTAVFGIFFVFFALTVGSAILFLCWWFNDKFTYTVVIFAFDVLMEITAHLLIGNNNLWLLKLWINCLLNCISMSFKYFLAWITKSFNLILSFRSQFWKFLVLKSLQIISNTLHSL